MSRHRRSYAVLDRLVAATSTAVIIRPPKDEARAIREAQILDAEAAVPHAGLNGRWLADCRECLDLPRRFGTPEARDLWVSQHIEMTRHRVGVGHA